MAAAIERGIIRRGAVGLLAQRARRFEAAKDRKPNTEASAIVDSDVPGGGEKTSRVRPRPAGAPPKASLPKMIAMTTRINATETTSKSSSVRAAVRMSRDAMSQTSAQPTSARGSHGACGGDPGAAQEGLPEDGERGDRDTREDEVGAQQRPAGDEAGARAERPTDERVHRAGAANSPDSRAKP